MAEVFKCRLSGIGGFDKRVVVKRIRPELAADPHFVDMFLDEARIAANLSHSNIVQIYEIDEVGGVPYIAMEYLRGPTFSLLIQQMHAQMRASLAVPARVMAGICAALDYAHHAADESGRPLNIIHRDVTPQNVLISMEGTPKLLDFGVAKARGQIAHTSAGSIKGKFKFMAPEAFHGTAVTTALDVFSVGVCLYQATTFHLPYAGEGELDVMRAAAAGKFPKPSELVPGFDPKLEKIILGAMEPNARDRCPSARLLQQQLEAYAADHGCTQETVADLLRALFPDALLDGDTVADVQSSDIVVTPLPAVSRSMVWGAKPLPPPPPPAPPAAAVPDEAVEIDLDDDAPASRAAGRAPRWLIASALAVLGCAAAFVAWKPAPAPPPVLAAPELPPPPAAVKVVVAKAEPVKPAPVPAPKPFVDAAAADRQALAVQVAETGSLKDASDPVRRVRAPPKPKNGGLTIETDPIAQVFLNGKALGLSPVRRQVLAEGTYQVSARHPKREPSVQDVTVVAGRETVVQLSLAEKPKPPPAPDPVPEPIVLEPTPAPPPPPPVPVPKPAPVVAKPEPVAAAQPVRHAAPAGLSFECPDDAHLVFATPADGAQAWCETADGEKHGRYVRLYPNGRKAEDGEYRRGKKHGRWLDFYEQGGERQRVEWRKGVQTW